MNDKPHGTHTRESVVGMVVRCPQCHEMYLPIDHSGLCENCWPEPEPQQGESHETPG